MTYTLAVCHISQFYSSNDMYNSALEELRVTQESNSNPRIPV